MNAIFYAFISYVGWGAGDIFGAIASRKIGGYKTTFWIMVAGAILFAPLIPLYWNLLISAPPIIIAAATLMGFFYMSGNFAVNEALKRADASIVLTINGSFGALIVLFSVLILHETISAQLIFIITIIFTGVFLCTFDPKSIKKHNKSIGIWLAMYASVSFGLFFTGVKVFAPTLSWFWPIYLSFLWLPLMYIFLVKIHEQPLLADIKKSPIPLLFNLLLLRSGDFAFNIGLQQGLAAVVAPIGGAYPTLSVILAFLVFHEKPTKRQVVGILLALSGIVLLGFAGSSYV